MVSIDQAEVTLRPRHRRLVNRGLALTLLLCWLLVTVDQGAGSSKHAVPELDEQDLPFYLDRPTTQDDAYLYLFSSLSLISLRRTEAVFELSRHPARGVTPLLRLPIHPPFDVSLPTEFFDVTIWGQLTHLFQKHLEQLTVEQEIIALFQELDELNARYTALFAAQGGNSSPSGKPLTLTRRNYVSEGRRESRIGQQRQTAHNREATQTFQHLIHQHDNPGPSERLVSPRASRAGTDRAPTLEARASAVESMHASETQPAPEGTGAIPEGRLVYLFRMSKMVIRYLLENKVESLIYFGVFILMSLSVKAAFRRL